MSPFLPILLPADKSRVGVEVRLDLAELLAVRLGQEEEGVDESEQGYDGEEVLDARRAAKPVEEAAVALDGDEHEQVGDAVGEAVGDAPDFQGEEFGSHGPRDRQQADHRGDDVEQQEDYRHPSHGRAAYNTGKS